MQRESLTRQGSKAGKIRVRTGRESDHLRWEPTRKITKLQTIMQNYYIRIEDMPSLVSHKLSIIKYVVLKKIIFFFLCFDRLIWTRSWLGLEPLWTWTCLGLDKGGLDYSPTHYTQLLNSPILPTKFILKTECKMLHKVSKDHSVVKGSTYCSGSSACPPDFFKSGLNWRSNSKSKPDIFIHMIF